MKKSWYRERFAGRPTDSGTKFASFQLRAAHRWLDFGTKLKVVCMETGRSVNVQINDRGPFISGRHLDLSQKAAEMLGLRKRAIGWVKVFVEQIP